MMETLHACRVGVMGFMNRRPGVQIVREESFVFGSNRERYTPTMLVRVPTSECMYHVIVEPIHYSVDERILPKSKHLENVENLIETMNRLVNHYDYMQRTYQKKEEVRFLIAAENLKGMNTAVRMMNKYCRNFNQRVFFTSDTVLSAVGNLEKSVIMAKEVKDAETQESHLGLVRPKHETLQQKNSWIFEIPG